MDSLNTFNTVPILVTFSDNWTVSDNSLVMVLSLNNDSDRETDSFINLVIDLNLSLNVWTEIDSFIILVKLLNCMIDSIEFTVLFITLLIETSVILPSEVCIVSDMFFTLPKTFVTSDMALPNTLFWYTFD